MPDHLPECPRTSGLVKANTQKISGQFPDKSVYFPIKKCRRTGYNRCSQEEKALKSGKEFWPPFLLTLLIFVGLFAQTKQYVWPTNASKLMSSSFCEFRPRHYHAAIDIKTWNRTGYKVFAVEDGYVMRVRVSAYGYGRAIYLKLRDGNIAVYGHLERFYPALEKFVNRYRLRHRQYRVDIHLKPGQFPVKRGQYIARSGKTGIGVPHLHFELRNAQNQPINPLHYYQSVIQDDIPPRLFELALIPMQGDAFINLQPDTLFVNLKGKSHISLSDTFLISGTVGIALKTYDWANGARNRFSFYRASMWVDDSLMYAVQYDKFSYGETRFIELDKNFSLWRRGLGIFHNFFRHPANSLDMYGETPPSGGLLTPRALKPGVHTLSIQVEDYWGNQANLEFPFQYGSPVPLQYDFLHRDSSAMFLRIHAPRPLSQVAAFFQDGTEWVQDTTLQVTGHLFFQNAHHYALFLNPLFAGQTCTLKLIGQDDTGFPTWPLFLNCPAHQKLSDASSSTCRWTLHRNWLSLRLSGAETSGEVIPDDFSQLFPGMVYFPVASGVTEIHLPAGRVLQNRTLLKQIFPCPLPEFLYYRPGHHLQVRSPDGLFLAEFGPSALYDSTAISLRTISPDTLPESDFRPIGFIYHLQPFDVPVNRGVRISLKLPPHQTSAKKIGLFYRNGEDDWSFIPADYDSLNRQFNTRVTSLEQFTLGSDTIPPVLIPAQRIRRDTLYSRSGYLTFVLKDEQTGIGSESHITVLVNGRWHLFEYDPEEDRLTVQLPARPSRAIPLEIRVRDNMGNQTIRKFLVQ